MAGFSYDLELTPFQAETLARHLQQTLNMQYDGPSHRGQMANYFAIDPETNYDPSPSPVAMRRIVAQVRDDGGRVGVSGLDASDAADVSTMLATTATRLQNDGPSGQALAEALTGLRTRFDKFFKVPEAEQDRLALISRPGALRERELAAARSRKAAIDERDARRAAERRDWERAQDEHDSFAAVASGGPDYMPMRGR